MNNKRGPKFFQTQEFKELNQAWNEKLKRSGFDDIENPNGSLKVKNRRTQGFQQQETLARISSALCSYIENRTIQITDIEKKILELHSLGTYRKDIIKITGRSHTTVWRVIRKHLPIALGIYSKDEM